jgi:hypothetical protein
MENFSNHMVREEVVEKSFSNHVFKKKLWNILHAWSHDREKKW